jgi:hypothetical protein
MTIAEQIRQIMLSEELSGADKLDRSAALIRSMRSKSIT